MSVVTKLRADQLTVERGLAPSRTAAQALILAGKVWSGEQRVEKPGAQLRSDAPLALRGIERYVSRGGHKLEGALADLGVDPMGLRVADLGASTGGFTDCLLQHGAARVLAVDVGTGLLHARLRADPRVTVLEGTNARHLTADDAPDGMDLVVVDASFIGLGKLLPAVSRILTPGGRLLAMVKPQFEAGREVARRNRGVLRDPAEREAALDNARGDLAREGFVILGEADSHLAGPEGNLERFMLARRGTA